MSSNFYKLNDIILVNDLQKCILRNYSSEKTEEYMNNTFNCQTKEAQQLFKAGMIYAALLASTECFVFSNLLIQRPEFEAYMEYVKKCNNE